MALTLTPLMKEKPGLHHRLLHNASGRQLLLIGWFTDTSQLQPADLVENKYYVRIGFRDETIAHAHNELA
jgi:hypothetical protein